MSPEDRTGHTAIDLDNMLRKFAEVWTPHVCMVAKIWVQTDRQTDMLITIPYSTPLPEAELKIMCSNVIVGHTRTAINVDIQPTNCFTRPLNGQNDR